MYSEGEQGALTSASMSRSRSRLRAKFLRLLAHTVAKRSDRSAKSTLSASQPSVAGVSHLWLNLTFRKTLSGLWAHWNAGEMLEHNQTHHGWK